MVSDETFAMTDIAQALQGPDAEGQSRMILERLAILSRETDARVAAGAGSEDFGRLNAISKSLAAVRRTVIEITSASY